MDLSIIIVNWNSKEYLRKCIASALAETRGLQFEIIVVDSASFDGCGQMLKGCYPDVRFIQCDKNLGFAKANNRGFLSSTGECVLFLNPDTELVGSAINVTYQHLQSLKNAGAVGCKLLNSDGTLQTSCIKSYPTLLNQFLDAEVLRKRFPRSQLWGMAALFAESSTPAEVDVISGAFIMMRRAVFEKIGMFTTKYFMYSEDVDLCFKARKHGYKNYFVPLATVVHHGGGSTNQNQASTFSSVMMMESRWRFFLNTRSRSYGWIYRVGMSAVSASRVVFTLVFWPFLILTSGGSKCGAILDKWCARFRWSVGLERWVSNY